MNLSHLDRPIAFQRSFVELTQSITGALLLSQAVYWQLRCKSEDGFWWKTYEEWGEETGMSRKELDSARKHCADFLISERRGIPAKNFYRVNVEVLQSRLSERDNLDRPKGTNRPDRNGQSIYTETTSEITSETKEGTPTVEQGTLGFEEFWGEYPRKAGKSDALKAWKKAKILDALPTVLDGLRKQKQSDQWKEDGGRFVPYPATWINGQRWQDELTYGHTKTSNGQSFDRNAGTFNAGSGHLYRNCATNRRAVPQNSELPGLQ